MCLRHKAKCRSKPGSHLRPIHLRQYLAMYCNGANDVVFSTAPAPQGPWTPGQMIVPSGQFPGGIYAPFLHPWSTGRELYFNLSEWNDYNVMLMKTVLP